MKNYINNLDLKKRHSSFLKKEKLFFFNDFTSKVDSVGPIDIKIEELGFDILELDASDWSVGVLLPEFRFVSRVIVPGLVPLSYGYGNEPLGMSRVYKIPNTLKLNRNALNKGEVNKFPHPFN